MESWLNIEQIEAITELPLWNSPDLQKYFYCKDWRKIHSEDKNENGEHDTFQIYIDGYSPIVKMDFASLLDVIHGITGDGNTKETITCRLQEEHSNFTIPPHLKNEKDLNQHNYFFQSVVLYGIDRPSWQVYAKENDIKAFCKEYGLPNIEERIESSRRLASEPVKAEYFGKEDIEKVNNSYAFKRLQLENRLREKIFHNAIQTHQKIEAELEDQVRELQKEIKRFKSGDFEILSLDWFQEYYGGRNQTNEIERLKEQLKISNLQPQGRNSFIRTCRALAKAVIGTLDEVPSQFQISQVMDEFKSINATSTKGGEDQPFTITKSTLKTQLTLNE